MCVCVCVCNKCVLCVTHDISSCQNSIRLVQYSEMVINAKIRSHTNLKMNKKQNFMTHLIPDLQYAIQAKKRMSIAEHIETLLLEVLSPLGVTSSGTTTAWNIGPQLANHVLLSIFMGGIIIGNVDPFILP